METGWDGRKGTSPFGLQSQVGLEKVNTGERTARSPQFFSRSRQGGLVGTRHTSNPGGGGWKEQRGSLVPLSSILLGTFP